MIAIELAMPDPTAIPRIGNETAMFKLIEASNRAAEIMPHQVKVKDCGESMSATHEAMKNPLFETASI
jgi:hypothetical protein